MNKPLIIIGAGGHAKVVLDAALSAGFSVLGMVDTNPMRQGDKVHDIPVIDGVSWMDIYGADAVSLVMGIGSVGNASKREEVFCNLIARGYRFSSIVHPSAVVAKDVTLGDGCVVMAGAVVQPGCRIEENIIINTGAQVDHDCHLSPHGHIAPGAILCGDVSIGRGTHIGAGATIIQGVTIGVECIVAAGAVVTCDAPAHATLKGVPAQISRYNER